MELGKLEGFWSELQLLQQALAKYLNVKQQFALAADVKRNQSAASCELIIRQNFVFSLLTY